MKNDLNRKSGEIDTLILTFSPQGRRNFCVLILAARKTGVH